jgi:uncharacterized protein (UPF0548 family)
MRIIWRFLGQRPNLAALLALPLSPGVEAGPQPGDRRDRYERVVAQEAPGDPESNGPFERVAAAILRYDIFPPSLVRGVLPRTPVEAGDIYGICAHMLPGIGVFFGGRVRRCFREFDGDVWRAGFTFQTIVGHPMIGEETFWVEKERSTGAVKAGLYSWSRPGMWLTRLGKPILRWVQVRASNAALARLAQMAGQSEPINAATHQ